jgi:hypothetical protein
MTFDEMIGELKVEVDNATKQPLIIQNTKGNWRLDSLSAEMTDDYALTVTGEIFSHGSYPFVYDKVFSLRLYKEMEVTIEAGKQGDYIDMHAMYTFLDEHKSELSQDAIEYLLSQEHPLAFATEMNPYGLVGKGLTNEQEKDLLNIIEDNAKPKKSLLKKLDEGKEKAAGQVVIPKRIERGEKDNGDR